MWNRDQIYNETGKGHKIYIHIVNRRNRANTENGKSQEKVESCEDEQEVVVCNNAFNVFLFISHLILNVSHHVTRHM